MKAFLIHYIYDFYLCTGAKNPSRIVGNNEKTYYTVNTCCSASGQYCPPYILYKAKSNKFIYEWMKDGPANAVYNTSSLGWMETQQFFEWFSEVFIKHTRKVLNLMGPLVLFLDGHLSHISIDLVDLAIENNVHIICLPPHSSHAWQPLDVGVYGPVKKCWRTILQEFYIKAGYENVGKYQFAALVNLLHKVAFFPEHAVAGFRIPHNIT